MKIVRLEPKGLTASEPIFHIVPTPTPAICGGDCYSGDGIEFRDGLAFRAPFMLAEYLALDSGLRGSTIQVVKSSEAFKKIQNKQED